MLRCSCSLRMPARSSNPFPSTVPVHAALHYTDIADGCQFSCTPAHPSAHEHGTFGRYSGRPEGGDKGHAWHAPAGCRSFAPFRQGSWAISGPNATGRTGRAFLKTPRRPPEDASGMSSEGRLICVIAYSRTYSRAFWAFGNGSWLEPPCRGARAKRCGPGRVFDLRGREWAMAVSCRPTRKGPGWMPGPVG